MHNIRYFLSGHTSKGLVNLLDENVDGVSRIIIFSHPSRYVKTAVIRAICSQHQASGQETILSPDGKQYLEGVIIRQASLAVITDQLASGSETYRSHGEILNLETDIQAEPTENHEKFEAEAARLVAASHELFRQGLEIHDQLEAIYINKMNFEQADQLAREIADKLLNSVPERKEKPLIRRRLFGTNTPDGTVNIVPELLDRVERADFIKGRAGTGKSTLMKTIANLCQEKGLDLEYYHCSFDPNSIDMILVPELNYCIFDATDPHEFFPQPGREGQRIVDTYEAFVEPGTDERFAAEVARTNQHYKTFMKKGVECLKEAGTYYDRIEAPYEKRGIEIQQKAAAIVKQLNINAINENQSSR